MDPGVGTGRRALAFTSRDHVWVGPDNGLLHFALQDADGFVYAIDPDRLDNRRLSATFHGRDVFAPAAAHLAKGRSLSHIGEPISPGNSPEDTTEEIKNWTEKKYRELF